MMHQAIARDEAVRSHVVRLLRHADLGAEGHARWAELSAAAGPMNIFAQHWFMDAALRHSASAHGVRLAVVSDRSGRWLGAMPLMQTRRFGRWPVASWRAWTATNQFLGAPLVRVDAAHDFWNALLAHLDERDGGETLIHCRQLAADNPVCAALIAHCDAAGRGIRILDRYDRPTHLPGDAEPSRKVRARLRSLRQRLESDHGPVSVEMHAADADCAPWIDAFLVMEKSGWKGQAGSALACAADTEHLFREVIETGHERGEVRLASLRAGGQVLAMSSWFETGDRGFGFKMTFDEGFRGYAPGQLLMHHIVGQVGEGAGVHFDTCAPPGSSGCYSLWRGKRTIFDCAVAIGSPGRRRLFGALMRARSANAAITGWSRKIGGALAR